MIGEIILFLASVSLGKIYVPVEESGFRFPELSDLKPLSQDFLFTLGNASSKLDNIQNVNSK